MKFGDVLKGFHGGQGAFRIFLELLVVGAVAVHLPVPLEVTVGELEVVEGKQEGPNEFAVDEVFESLGAAVLQQLRQILHSVLFSLFSQFGTF